MNKVKVGKRDITLSKHISTFAKNAKAYFHLPYRQTEGIVKAHAESKLPSS